MAKLNLVLSFGVFEVSRTSCTERAISTVRLRSAVICAITMMMLNDETLQKAQQAIDNESDESLNLTKDLR